MDNLTTASCPFCILPQNRVVDSNELVLVIRDAYPVSKGHTLLITRRHVSSVFEVTEAEWLAVHTALGAVKSDLDRQFQPDGYNIGINVGELAGQTVWHVHVHVIPRYRGDHPHPRGGVRHVLPGRGNPGDAQRRGQ